MTDELTRQREATLRFKREVENRFGVLPNFFCSADAAPGLVEKLWKFAKSAYRGGAIAQCRPWLRIVLSNTGRKPIRKIEALTLP